MKDSTKLLLKSMGAAAIVGFGVVALGDSAFQLGAMVFSEKLVERCCEAESGDEIAVPDGEGGNFVIRKR